MSPYTEGICLFFAPNTVSLYPHTKHGYLKSDGSVGTPFQ